MAQALMPPSFWVQGTDPQVPWNDNALRQWISQASVNNSTTAQPSLTSPADDGKCYIIQSTHTGAQWATFTPKSIAIFYGGGWYEFTPTDGFKTSVGGAPYIYTGGSWTAFSAAASWGAITGTLASQTDLQAALDAKGAVGVPQNSQSAAYTLVLSDANKHIYHPAADTTARTWTIPANSSVPFPIGTAVTFDNDFGAGAITIAITTDTLVLVGAAGSTGSRTLASGGQATAIKVTSTRWRISGTGLT